MRLPHLSALSLEEANFLLSCTLHGKQLLNSLSSNLDLYSASDHLPSTLLSADKGHSYDVDKTAFQDAVGTTKPRWEWLEERVPLSKLRTNSSGYPGTPELALKCPKSALPSAANLSCDSLDGTVNGAADGLYLRPEHEVFSMAMLGGGRVFGAAHVHG